MTRIGPSTIRVATGQMLSNTQKHFVMTFNVPTTNIGSVSLGAMRLNHQVHGEQLQTQVNSDALVLAVVAPEYRIQARQSINEEVYQNSWIENNLGIMKKKISKWMREGKKDRAQREIKAYRKEIEAASADSNIPLASPIIKGKLEEMEKQVDDAFTGSLLDQQVKRNRAAKNMQYESIETQRK